MSRDIPASELKAQKFEEEHIKDPINDKPMEPDFLDDATPLDRELESADVTVRNAIEEFHFEDAKRDHSLSALNN